jgi:uncharacterized protein YkwD
MALNMKKFLKYAFVAFLTCISPYSFAKSTYNDADIQKSILNVINSYRTEHKLPPLQMVKEISLAAHQHSVDMAENKMPFGHDEFHSRVHSLGNKYENIDAAAENVAYTSSNPKEIASMWLNSYGHRKNIEGDYNLTGIGIAHGEHGKTYVTQIFLRA